MQRITTNRLSDESGKLKALLVPSCDKLCIDVGENAEECEHYVVICGVEYCKKDCVE